MLYQNNFSFTESPAAEWNTWMRFNMRAIIVSISLSMLFFAIYIFIFYLGNVILGKAINWNQQLPDLYDANNVLSTAAIALHFFTGVIILALGFIQLLSAVRTRYPKLHRVLGRIYLSTAFLTGVGGLIYILVHGTVGGLVMDIGFGGYGALVIICVTQTFRYAKKHAFRIHRIWALRLFALALGSWLYRMEYGFWFFITDGIGHSKSFNLFFDRIMSFAFYLPNLGLLELMLRVKEKFTNTVYQNLLGCVLACCNLLVIVGTYSFLTLSWLPGIKAVIA